MSIEQFIAGDKVIVRDICVARRDNMTKATLQHVDWIRFSPLGVAKPDTFALSSELDAVRLCNVAGTRTLF